ncbi:MULTISPECIES: COX15/CtaA family protein [unclassified Caulobacter]|jgi:cytochrome c oxidase assembly protein subunit 15|uniref:COX15/CtaA family protein n=1 Tax=unclassified Caulobacter TaxID=2648921 RepID=UPI00078478B8|nr:MULTISPECIES: COX15/CtaA family protein [unclassified Caulobacter]AZS21630.1 heme A synthase [Caulobacter sp. FWC26]
MTSFLRSDRSRPVAIWLFFVAAMVFAMVVVGGATRLTDSGLSITEWKPILGALPPMSDDAWRHSFDLYKQIPQYHLVNPDMTLDEFKGIFWWEWAHRLLGRVVGAAFAIPFIVFLIRRDIPRRLVWRCGVMLALGGLQGLVGWWMVSSGLSERVSVAPERLMTHLGLALLLFVVLIWTALDAWNGAPRVEERSPWRSWALAFLGAVYFQSLLGALVAGNDAGLIYNDWPLMNGRFFPADYAGAGFWGTLAHSQAAVQFNHRLFAYVLFVGAIAMAVIAWRDRTLVVDGKRAAMAVAITVTLQAALGVWTLMAAVPISLGVLHQAGAAVLLAVTTMFAWRVRRP